MMDDLVQQELDAVIDRCVARRMSLKEVTKVFRARYVQRAVDSCHGNQCWAARKIKTHRSTIGKFDVKVEKARRKPMGIALVDNTAERHG